MKLGPGLKCTLHSKRNTQGNLTSKMVQARIIMCGSFFWKWLCTYFPPSPFVFTGQQLMMPLKRWRRSTMVSTQKNRDDGCEVRRMVPTTVRRGGGSCSISFRNCKDHRIYWSQMPVLLVSVTKLYWLNWSPEDLRDGIEFWFEDLCKNWTWLLHTYF